MNKQLQTWLEQTLNANFTLFTIKPGASHRHFYRLQIAPQTHEKSFVVMVSPPDVENNSQFVSLNKLFLRNHIPVAKIIAKQEDHGYFLLADLGKQNLSDFYNTNNQQSVLYQAIDGLIKIQAIKDDNIAEYTATRFYDELSIFTDWFLGKLFDQELTEALKNETWPLLVTNAVDQPQCCIHRDYHSQNLLLNSAKQLGIVDYQDALMGPVSYDLASLLRDCYHRFSEANIAHYRYYYLTRSSLEVDPEQFSQWLDLMAVQRQLKAVGIFVRLFLRDGKRNHLGDVEPVLQHLQSLSAKYQLEPLSALLNNIVPLVGQRLSGLGKRAL